MSITNRLNRIRETARHIPLTDSTKLVLMSDCHRGTGSGADNFAKNQNLYYAAMQHYEREGFTYIELGDGDELWENRRFADIVREYPHVFGLLARLYRQNRMHMIYGNHDMVKKHPRWIRNHMSAYWDDMGNLVTPLFPEIEPQEGLVLKLPQNKGEILLIHGHQADFLNYDLWHISKFLVRYVWQPMQLIGVREPFSASKSHKSRLSVEGKLSSWCDRHKNMLIAGHTHRPAFPKAGEGLYFNDGCLVNPRHITAIEIQAGAISLVKWRIATKPSGVLFVDRVVVKGPASLEAYFPAG